MKRYYILVLVLSFIAGWAQDKQPYQIYNKEGKKTTYANLLKEGTATDVILFGEHHDNSIVHWLQLELTKDLAGKKKLVLGAEMLEADDQKSLNAYLEGRIDHKVLDSFVRLWPNYKTDYKPLVDFAKEKHFPVIATNVPRRYASMVYKGGLEALDKLPADEKEWIAPLPIAYDANLPGYKGMLEMAGGHGGENLPKAQAIKDATMAHFILANIVKGTVFIHFNGTYHSENFEGINWYINRQAPSVKMLTIATVSQKDISALEKEHLQKADYIIVVDEDVTKTH